MTSERPEIAELPAAAPGERDGIGELDNPVPLWFNLAFLGTLLFGVVYILWYTLSGWSQLGQYREEVERRGRELAASRAAAPPPSANPYRGDAAAIAEGKEVFATICVACHLPDGRGLVGPSLVDPYWKYGSDDAALFETVARGRPAGMPPWGTLGDAKIWKALAYLETLPRSDEPGLGAPGYALPAPAP
jgi:cytochrome c oxidase cbb3-type subunit 3